MKGRFGKQKVENFFLNSEAGEMRFSHFFKNISWTNV